MTDQPNSEDLGDKTPPSNEQESNTSGASSFFASAWSAWGKVGKIYIKNNFHYLANLLIKLNFANDLI